MCAVRGDQSERTDVLAILEGYINNRAKPTGIDVSVANFIPLPNPHKYPVQEAPQVLSEIVIPPVIETQRRPGPRHIPYGIPEDQWPTVLHHVCENHESYRKVAKDYGVSRETIRRLVQASIRLGRSDPN